MRFIFKIKWLYSLWFFHGFDLKIAFWCKMTTYVSYNNTYLLPLYIYPSCFVERLFDKLKNIIKIYKIQMPFLTINNINNALVIGPVHGSLEILEKVNAIQNQYDIIIFNGGLLELQDKFKNNKLMSAMSDMLKTSKVIYNIGRDDYKLSINNDFISNWIKGKPNVVNLIFPRGTSTLVIDGGITSEMLKIEELYNNIEISFVNQINGQSWHKSYNGRLGYIIANQPLSSSEPKFFNYSVQLGIERHYNKVYAQEVKEHGLGDTFLL